MHKTQHGCNFKNPFFRKTTYKSRWILVLRLKKPVTFIWPCSWPPQHTSINHSSRRSCLSEPNLLSFPLTIAGQASECPQSSEPSTEDADLWSREMEADESLKMSHQTIESLLLGVGTRLESEDYLMGISSRLQTALEKMLMVITDTSNQVQSSPTRQSHFLHFLRWWTLVSTLPTFR